ncbi:hypothetical protein P12x_005601 [Tundrisphaera lichenicola]|uniref:hypothetical protein n=1 Tax=Tundrisphaera lichenicola TaxID=2029860 RepID=UPI003EBCE1AF
MPRTHLRPFLPLALFASAIPIGSLAGCSQADNPKIPEVAVPEPPENSKPLNIPKKGGQPYGASSKYEELMNKKFENQKKSN